MFGPEATAERGDCVALSFCCARHFVWHSSFVNQFRTVKGLLLEHSQGDLSIQKPPPLLESFRVLKGRCIALEFRESNLPFVTGGFCKPTM